MVTRVKVEIKGPRTLIRSPIKCEVSTRTSWSSLLNGHFQLALPPGVIICSSEYRPRNERAHRGWRASLNEPISRFIENYRRSRRVYKVRLHRPEERRGRWSVPRPNGVPVQQQDGPVAHPLPVSASARFIQEVRQAVARLQQSGEWERYLQESPLACDMILELIRE